MSDNPEDLEEHDDEFDELLQQLLLQFEARFRRLRELRIESDEAKTAEKAATKAFKDYEQSLWDQLEASPLKPPYKFDLGDGVVSFHPKETYYGRIYDEQKARAWLEEQGLTPSHVEEKISAARLNEEVRELIEAREAMPPGIDFRATRYITQTEEKD